jgi:hypothetical protein
VVADAAVASGHSCRRLCSRVPFQPHKSHVTLTLFAILSRMRLGSICAWIACRQFGHLVTLVPTQPLQKTCAHGRSSTGLSHASWQIVHRISLRGC